MVCFINLLLKCKLSLALDSNLSKYLLNELFFIKLKMFRYFCVDKFLAVRTMSWQAKCTEDRHDQVGIRRTVQQVLRYDTSGAVIDALNEKILVSGKGGACVTVTTQTQLLLAHAIACDINILLFACQSLLNNATQANIS